MKIYKYHLSDFTDDEYAFWHSYLHESKRNRVDSYKHEADRRRSVCAHMLALKGISEHTSLSVDKIIIAEEENGKPYCQNADIFFSLSHSDDIVVCAVSDKPVGVDIEKIRPINTATARRICNDKELAYVFGNNTDTADCKKCDNKEILTRFFEIWVKKEAFGKRKGTGIAYDMKNADIPDIPCNHEGDYVIAVCE